MGNSFSTSGATNFTRAAKANDIEVYPENYHPGESMTQVIENVIDANKCEVIVVFATYSDYSALLLEAHKQGYKGEWILGSNSGDGVYAILQGLGKELGTEKAYEILRGEYESTYTAEVLHSVSPYLGHYCALEKALTSQTNITACRDLVFRNTPRWKIQGF